MRRRQDHTELKLFLALQKEKKTATHHQKEALRDNPGCKNVFSSE